MCSRWPNDSAWRWRIACRCDAGCSRSNGYSRYIVHWDIPWIISDNGAQFIARDFKELIRILGMTHVRTSPGYPQSNGKLERWHGTIKSECIRPGTPLSVEDARRLVTRWVGHYNHVRLHSALGYVTPADKLAGREQAIYTQRDRKLEAAREQRQAKRHAARAKAVAEPASAN